VPAGLRTIVFAQDVEAARAFFRGVLDLAQVNKG
jgi:catechol 2,3-dioxygenase-like lactoylglutathione lyase family enzyme